MRNHALLTSHEKKSRGTWEICYWHNMSLSHAFIQSQRSWPVITSKFCKRIISICQFRNVVGVTKHHSLISPSATILMLQWFVIDYLNYISQLRPQLKVTPTPVQICCRWFRNTASHLKDRELVFDDTHNTRLRYYLTTALPQDDVIKWKHFPRYWPFVRGIHRSPSRPLWRHCNVQIRKMVLNLYRTSSSDINGLLTVKHQWHVAPSVVCPIIHHGA